MRYPFGDLGALSAALVEALEDRSLYSELSANAKTAYSLLLSYAWHNHLCFPGQERLAEHMGAHVSTVSRAITELEDYALIEIERRGQGKTNVYQLNLKPKKV